MFFVRHEFRLQLRQVAGCIALAPELVEDPPVPHHGPFVVFLAPRPGREVLQPFPVHPQIIGLARRETGCGDLPGAGAVVIQHIGQAVAALPLKDTVQYAGIIAKKHRLIVVDSLFFEKPCIKQLVPA